MNLKQTKETYSEGNGSSLKISFDSSGSYSLLSNVFIDHYMVEAPHASFIKVYLYLLRMLQSNQSISIQDIADRLYITESDVKRGLKYWVSKGVIQMDCDEDGNPSGIVLCQLTAPETRTGSSAVSGFRILKSENGKQNKASYIDSYDAPEEEADSDASARHTAQSLTAQKKKLDAALTDAYFLDLSSQATAYFGPLSNEDIDALWEIYGDLELPFGVCEYLLEYCAEDKENHPERMNPKYYLKVAKTWKQNNLRTKDEARQFTKNSFIETKILRALGVRDRAVLQDGERRRFQKWKEEYGFTDEVIIFACDRAILTRPKAGIGYVDGILTSWHNSGFKTVEEIEKNDTPSSGAKSSSGKKTKKSPAGGEYMQGSLVNDLGLLEQLAVNKRK